MQSELLPNPWNLPEVLHALVAPVYETFSFYELPRQFVEQELERLVRRG